MYTYKLPICMTAYNTHFLKLNNNTHNQTTTQESQHQHINTETPHNDKTKYGVNLEFPPDSPFGRLILQHLQSR